MDNVSSYIKSKDKKDWVVFGAIVCSIALAFAFVNKASAKNARIDSSSTDGELASSIKHANLKKYFTEQLNSKIDNQSEQYNKVKEELASKSKVSDEDLQALKSDNESLHEELFNLKIQLSQENARSERVDEGHQTPSQDIFSTASRSPSQSRGSSYENDSISNEYIQQAPINEIESVSVELDSSSSDSQYVQTAVDYVTSGTHVKGVLLGGIDAHTEVYGNNESRVVTIRFIEDGIMPNGFKAKVKNCVLLASAWGNASSERVVMRGERLSCIHKDGQVFEQDIVGIIYGPDGREDVRGRVVYPEGKLVQRAFIAGTLSGLGAAVGEGSVTKSISPLGSTTTVQPGDVFSYGAAQGAHKSLDKLADYYIKRAEKLQPIVQVPAGVKVDVVFQKGFSISKSNYRVQSGRVDERANKQNAVKDAREQAMEVLGE